MGWSPWSADHDPSGLQPPIAQLHNLAEHGVLLWRFVPACIAQNCAASSSHDRIIQLYTSSLLQQGSADASGLPHHHVNIRP